MKPAIVMAVWNEQPMLPGCFESIAALGFPLRDVLVVDGAWKGYKGGRSTDATEAICAEAGVRFMPCPARGWESQEQKRSAMFAQAHRESFSHALVLDADERLAGNLPSRWPESHGLVQLRTVGPNDLPGIRGNWPNGGYSQEWHPRLRWFRLSEQLHCKWPGGYFDPTEIRPYGPRTAPSLPLVQRLRITHHASEQPAERTALKRDYYTAEHPERRQRQALQRALAPVEGATNRATLAKLRSYHERRLRRADAGVHRAAIKAIDARVAELDTG